MNDAFCLGALNAVSENMGHDVVADNGFSWVISSPNSFSASARAIQSFRQVLNFISGEKRYFIFRLGYRSDKGLL